mmetsp:Transcript_13758/g.20743  ORF Transcript_13758/g.20743 Transcript_13758/m.20743 type:complete len:253 (-) Transcript_13758:127-885(-)
MIIPIHSPLSTDVYSSLSSLSPPPTPIAKRSRHFFQSSTTSAMPMFFPMSQSLFYSSGHRCHHSDASPSIKDEEATEKKKLKLIASRPASILRLMPRSRTNISQTREGTKRIQVDQLPPLPSSYLDTSLKSIKPMIPRLPFLSDSTKTSDSSQILESTFEKKEHISNQQAMQSAFQRTGANDCAVQKRTSNSDGSDCSKSCDSKSVVESIPKKSRSDFGPHEQAKLPSFQRGGTGRKHYRVEKRNRFAARSA